MGTLSDQLLKAGLVTKEQVKKASEKPKKKRSKPKAKNTKTNTKKEKSDLADFYNQRSKQEKIESQEAARKKKEAARIKKETNDKINALITKNIVNDEAAEIRYNFVVGTTIKYVFVTEEQQKQLAESELAITFLGGKRALIPAAIGEEITKLNPNKIVVLAER